jgi:UDP-N-acetylmuramoylalanine-D-glutamate ligase
MAEAILRGGGVSALACGNVGIPFVTALYSDVSCAVAEISSFTLEYTAPKTRRAVITNITENHLDWHGSFDRYIKAQYNATIRKLARIYKMAKKGNRNGQIDFGGHTIEAYLEGIAE